MGGTPKSYRPSTTKPTVKKANGAHADQHYVLWVHSLPAGARWQELKDIVRIYSEERRVSNAFTIEPGHTTGAIQIPSRLAAIRAWEQFRDLGWETRDATTKRLLARHKVIVSVRGPLQQSQLRDQVDGNTLMVLDAVRPCVEGPGGRSAEVGTLGPTSAIENTQYYHSPTMSPPMPRTALFSPPTSPNTARLPPTGMPPNLIYGVAGYAPPPPVGYQPYVLPSSRHQDVTNTGSYYAVPPSPSSRSVTSFSTTRHLPQTSTNQSTSSRLTNNRHAVPQTTTTSSSARRHATASLQPDRPPQSTPTTSRQIHLPSHTRHSPSERKSSPASSTTNRHSNSQTNQSTQPRPPGPLVVDGARGSRNLARRQRQRHNAEEWDSSDYGQSDDDGDYDAGSGRSRGSDRSLDSVAKAKKTADRSRRHT